MSKKTTEISTVTQMMSPFEKKEFIDGFELAVTSEFLQYETKAKELAATAAAITCNNTEEANIARARIIDAQSWIKMLTEKHKKIKSPLLTMTRILDARKKAIEENMDAAKASIVTKVTFWDTLEKQKEAARLNELRQQKMLEDQKILNETSRLDRLVKNVRALLYGGTFTTSSGSSEKPGCITIEQVEAVEGLITRNIPGPAEFSEKTLTAYNETVKIVTDMIAARKTAVLTTGGNVLSDREVNIISETNSIVENQGQRLTRENEKIERDLSATDKGFRRVIVHEVWDLEKVPREFLMINDAAINQWKIDHREEILEGLRSGVKTQYDFVSGIKFNVNQTSITR